MRGYAQSEFAEMIFVTPLRWRHRSTERTVTGGYALNSGNRR
jgi:hypothetical protein